MILIDRMKKEQLRKVEMLHDCFWLKSTKYFATGDYYCLLPRTHTLKPVSYFKFDEEIIKTGRSSFNRPSLFTPFGRILSPISPGVERKGCGEASFKDALAVTLVQLCYDIVYTMYYAVVGVPRLIGGILGYVYAVIRYDRSDIDGSDIKNAAKDACLDILMCPYFAVAIVIDLLKELCALFTRTLATLLQRSTKK